MALIKCPQCGKEFSEYAEKCPQCGMPLAEAKEKDPKGKGHGKKITTFLLCSLGVVIIAFLCYYFFSDGLTKGKHSVQDDFIDKTEEENVIQYIYNLPGDFSEGLAHVYLNEKCGFVDKTGKTVIPFMYRDAGDFSEGLAWVKRKDFYSYIDMTGKESIPSLYDYDDVGPFSEGLAWVRRIQNGKFGYIDKSGDEVIPCIYEYPANFSEGLAVVRQKDKCGFIDRTGKKVIQCVYENADDFSEGLARVKRNGKWGFIDKTGNVVIPCVYENADNFSEELARVLLDDKWGFIDKTGNVVIPRMYDYGFVGNFSEGLARAKRNGKFGFIDKTGKEVIPCMYDDANDFSEGLVRVQLNYKYGYIDKTGKEVIPCTYNGATDFSEGVAWVAIIEESGLIDKTGKAVAHNASSVSPAGNNLANDLQNETASYAETQLEKDKEESRPIRALGTTLYPMTEEEINRDIEGGYTIYSPPQGESFDPDHGGPAIIVKASGFTMVEPFVQIIYPAQSPFSNVDGEIAHEARYYDGKWYRGILNGATIYAYASFKIKLETFVFIGGEWAGNKKHDVQTTSTSIVVIEHSHEHYYYRSKAGNFCLERN